MNYSQGTAALCLESMVSHADLMNARERIKRERKEGKTVTEMIQEQKGAVSAGKCANLGIYRIGKTVFDLVNMNTTKIKLVAREKGDAARVALLAKVEKAKQIRALGKPISALTIDQLKTLLAPLKRQGDPGLPTKKADIVRRLVEWEARGPLLVEEEVANVVATTASEMRAADCTNEEEDDTAQPGHMEEV